MTSRRKLILLTVCGLMALSLVGWGVGVVLRGIRIRSLARQCWHAPFGDVEKCIDQLADEGPAAAGALSRLLEHPNWQVRVCAAQTMEATGSAMSAPRLRPCLTDTSWVVRMRAAKALRCTGDASSWGDLVRAVDDPSPHAQCAVAQALCSLEDERGCEHLVRLAGQADSECVRAAAAVLLARVCPKRAVPWALRVVTSGPFLHREAAASILARQKLGEDAVGPLAQALNCDSTTIRRSAAAALGNTRSDEAVPWLKNALSDESRCVRMDAVLALKAIGSERAVEALAFALQNGSSAVRWHAVRALRSLRDKRAMAALVEAARDESQAVKECALLAIWEMAGAELDVGCLDSESVLEWWRNAQ